MPLVRPKSAFYKDVLFQHDKCRVDVKLSSEGVEYTKELRPVSGNQIMSLPILAEVFSLLNCPDKKCRGRVHLYEHIMQDGLQKFLLIKFRICHLLVAEFPASLPNGIPADACVNNKSVRVKGQSELNIRSLIAVHSTSQSWEEFRLSCSVLDVNVPTATMSRTHMIRFVQATRNVVCASIKASGQIVHSVLPSEPSLPITLRNCTVSFDASWHRRGHFSNQGFAAVIESESGKVLDYQLYDRVCFSCSSWTEERKASCPDVYAKFWDSHKALCNSNLSGSSQSMESSAAVEVWKRSIETHGLIYGTYIGDGDSSSYKNLVKSNPYDEVASVRKEECLGLVQKRIKKRLSKTTKSSKGLFEVKADRIAHLYALVIVQHKGESAQDFHEALHILLRHTEEKHDTCPGGNSSCCYYQNLLAKHLEDNPFPLQSPERHSCQVQSSSGRKMCLKYSHLLSSVSASLLDKHRTPRELT